MTSAYASAYPEEDRYRQLIEGCVDAIFLLHEGRIVGANRAAATLVGAPSAELLHGRVLADLLKTPQRAGAPFPLQLDVCPASYERQLVLANNSVADVEITIAPYLDRDSDDGRVIVVRDVSARKRIAAALHQQDQYLRVITDAVPALIAYVDSEQRYRFVNAAYEQWFGLARRVLIGSSMRDVLGAAYAQAQPYVARALAGEQVSYETRIESSEGVRHALAVYTPDRDENGKVCGFSVMVNDITERKSGERQLRERAHQLRLITDAAPVFIARCDPEYRLTFANRTYLDRFRLSPRDIVGKRIPELVGEPAFGRLREFIDTALAGTPCEHEVKLPAADADQQYYMRMMYVPEFDAHGKVRGLVAAVTDVSRLRETEERLHRREREFKTLVEHSPDIIARIDRQMRHLYVNPSVEKLSGLKASAYIGKTKAELGLPESVVRAWDNATRAAFDTGSEQRLLFEYEQEGQIRYFSGRVVPEIDASGQIESVVVIAYDVTERARMEKERDELLARERSARIQAETAARARDEFLAIVSHELRAPLNGIQSWAHVLENYVKDATSAPLAQRALQGIKTGVGQQVRLIEDLLDVTRMMSGKLRLVRQPLALLPTLQAAVESVRPLAAAKRIALTCTYRITTEQIEGDADRVQQIFWNLLSNAIKFTHEGGNVWMAATHSEREICVSVRDDGVGISPEFLPHLFDRFSQADTSSTRNHSGLGLGLFLVRHLVELHEGRVTAESRGEGTGTTFTVHFPLRARSQKYAAVAPYEESGVGALPLPSLDGLQVLLIDDQEEARESLTVVLSSAGAQVYAASSGAEAVQWLEGRAEDAMPDVLVCDIAMPGEDGYAVLRRLRTWTNAAGKVPLARMPALALTAFAHREDRIRALTAGFQMHVTKPVAAEELIVVIDTMVTR
ncbi:MAG TPA: PAS domain-containing protein [Noviherbaspirillum sp.]|nr:PAS domain-containing protein [Noviherbaspirillum sp.]